MRASDNTFSPGVGDELPALEKAPDREQLVKYAAGSGDFNPLHYDPDFPQARAIGDNIVHGRMKYAAMGQLVSDWLGHRGWIRRITAQYRGMDNRGATFTCRGRVVDVRDEGGARVVEVEVWTEDANGATTTTGRAEVVLP
jgi:acyl dehydratase